MKKVPNLMTGNNKLISLKDVRRIIPGLVISLGLLWLVFYAVDFTELTDVLLNANYNYLLPAILLFLISMGARTIAWRILLEEKVSCRRVFLTLNEGYLLNNVLPFRMGEIGRAFILSRTGQVSFWQVLSTIMIERVLDVLMVVGILLSTLPFVVGIEGASAKALIIGGFVSFFLLILYVLARYQKTAVSVFQTLQIHLPPLRLIKAAQLETFFRGLVALTDIRRFLMVVFWMASAWVLVTFQYYLILLAFLPGAKFVFAGFGIGMVGLGVTIPSAPGGIGVVEATLVFVFGLLGVQRSIALAYSIVVHAVYLFVTSMLGVYGFMHDGESLAQIYHQIRSRGRSAETVVKG